VDSTYTPNTVEEKPVQEYTPNQKKVVHAMEVIGQVAKLYKKRGKPPVFVPIQPEINPARMRERLAKQTVRPALYGCTKCNLLFIGKVRCQCKPMVKARTEAA
jgi:hypothetical protein